MAITGSPGITIQEEDLSSFVAADSVTTAAFAGDFDWGPVNELMTVSSESKLIQIYGYPNDRNYKDWFCARNYTNYSTMLKVNRVVGTGSVNACDEEGKPFTINNSSEYEFNKGDIIGTGARIFARYPGDFGNKIRVCILNKAAFDKQKAALEDGTLAQEDKNPITNYISNFMGKNDIAVGVWVNGTIREYGVYSTVEGSTDVSGYENYVFKYFNNNSNYIYLVKENFVLDNEISWDFTLTGGSSAEITLSDRQTAWDLIRGADEDDIQLLFQGGCSDDDMTVAVGNYIEEIASERKDCIACISPLISECVNVLHPVKKIIEGSAAKYSNSVITLDINGVNLGKSYSYLDGNYKYQYDRYNDVYRWVPLNGDIAGLFAYIDDAENPWMSIGGKAIKDCVKLAFNPSKAERDELFASNVNPVCHFKEEGNVVWGDWTRINETSFNFVGVRRCFLYMEKAIKSYARKVMWKQNDEVTETTFRQIVEPFLTQVQGGRGISEFKVYLGDAVSTPDERDRGIFKAKILVKPVRSIRYVWLIFTAVRSDVNIEEVVE